MPSSRLNWDLPPNRLAALAETKRLAGRSVLDLTQSNPTRVGLDYPPSILEALADERSLVYAPAARGSEEARSAVAGYHAARGVPVDPDQVVLAASTSEAYSWLFKLLADPGDEVLVPRPSYPLLDYLAALECIRLAPYPLLYEGCWRIDTEALARRVTSRTRAIIVVSPNNPTGSFLKQDELEALIRLCRRHGLAILCDEVFADYAFYPDPRRARSLAAVDEVTAFCLSGLSKAAGLPQMKLAWIVVNGPRRGDWLGRLDLIADTYLSVSTPIQHAAARLLRLGEGLREQIHRRVRNNLAWLRSRAGPDSNWRLLDVEGGWYGILEVPRTRTEEEWTLTLLDQDDVLAQPGYFFDFEREAFLGFSFLPPPETFREGLDRLLARVRQDS